MSRKNSVSEYKFADVVIDRADFRVRKAEESRKITPRAFEVLLYLIAHRGRTVEKREIFEQVWRESFVSDNALTRIVKEIRQVIGDDANSPLFIETVPKRGYRFIAEVEETENKMPADEDSPSPAISDEPAKSFAKPQRSSHLIFVIVLLTCAVVLLGGWLFFRNQDSTNTPIVTRTAQITRWSGLDNFPAISPDGNSLAYSSDQSGNFEIYVKPLASDAKEIQITGDGNQNFQPAFSPDGQRIAFHSKTRGGIWIIPVSGGTAKQLTNFGTNPAWSPDGQQIAFQSGAITDLGAVSRTLPPSVLWLVPANGGEPYQLTRAGSPLGGHSSPAWSPDGKRIAFNVGDLLSYGLWSIQISDGKVQKISLNGFEPVYAPDGTRIYYATLNGLWQIPVSSIDGKPTGEPVKLADDGPAQIRGLRISADGKKIVYGMLMSKSSLAALPLDANGEAVGNPMPLLQNAAFRNTFPAFSPDGSRFVYVSWQTGSSGTLWLVNSDGQSSSELTTGYVPNWFSDGEQIGFISERGGTKKFMSINSLTGKETEAHTFKSDVDFARISPNGKEIAFNSKENGTINVWLANLETGEEKQITFDPEFMGFPVWSPDGKTLAVQIKRGEDTHIALIPANGGEAIQLTNERGQSWVHSFSPDGERLVFAGQRDNIWNIYSVSRSTREKKKLTNYDKFNSYVRYPAWSPRNDKIIFEYAEMTGNIWLTELK